MEGGVVGGDLGVYLGNWPLVSEALSEGVGSAGAKDMGGGDDGLLGSAAL